MYFLINQWGSANREYASLKFMIYTMGGSLGLLLGIQMLGVVFKTFDLAIHHCAVEHLPEAAARHAHRDREDHRLLGLRDCLRSEGSGMAFPHLAA